MIVCVCVYQKQKKVHSRFLRIQKHKKMSLILCLSFQLLFKHLIYCFLICSPGHCVLPSVHIVSGRWQLHGLELYTFSDWLLHYTSSKVWGGEYWLAKFGSNVSHCGCLNIARNAGTHSTSKPSVACFWAGKTFPDKTHTLNAIDIHFSKQPPSKEKEDSVHSSNI